MSMDMFLSGDEEVLRDWEMSSASMVMSAMRCTKLAGLGALSALCVLKRSSNLYGFCSVGEGCFKADETRER